MANPDPPPSTPPWPFWTWPAGLLDALKMPTLGAAPQQLNQPILPWVFANSISVNEANSSCPEMEREILSRHSYGRQLGRVIKALEALIQERPEGAPPNAAFDEFMALGGAIEAIKAQSSASRVERLKADLAWVQEHDAEQYRRIVAAWSQPPAWPTPPKTGP